MLPLSVPFSQEVFASTSSDAVGLDHGRELCSYRAHQSLSPASSRSEKDNIEPYTPNEIHLSRELDVARLNDIHKWLWVVGRPMPPRSLHQQKILGREIVVTERMDLHLVWDSNRIFIKPIPRFLLDYSFWQDYLLCKPHCICTSAREQHSKGQNDRPCECAERRLYKYAAGFLISYTGLISHESDYHIARSDSLNLLSPAIAWPQWILLVEHLLTRIHPNTINRRYLYGELHLNRLNAIYHLTCRNVLRGYVSGYRTYSDFFRASFTRIFAVFAYVTVVLTAMQVALATQELGSDERVQRASYGFAVFSILGPLLVLGVVLAFVGVAFVGNLRATLRYRALRTDGFRAMEKGSLEGGFRFGA